MLAKTDAAAIDADAIRRAAELIRPHVCVHAGDRSVTGRFRVEGAEVGLQARAFAARRLVQAAWRLHQSPDAQGAARGRGGGIGRKSRRGRRLRRAEASACGRRSSCRGRCRRRSASESAPTAPTWSWAASSTPRRSRRAKRLAADGRDAGPRLRPARDAVGQGTSASSSRSRRRTSIRCSSRSAAAD